MKKYLLAVLVDNKPGVLTHVSGLISRRAFNIESISAGYTEEADVTRINIVVSVESKNELDQVMTQLSKLIDVIKIVNLTEVDSIARELVMIKVRATRENRAELIDIVNIFRANIVDVSQENVVIELTGQQSKIDGIIEVLSEYEIIEIARTGAIALSRGPIPAKNM
ncbi:MAG: acetolactate synthase small subunit [Selenomonas sp.]|nr:acetolactate synthase small subunit [Selenomonas sp.]MBQ1614123.1 acetolactate synthase small subunit [Selenomonas sp.]MBQ1919332.1 acetolactate synthase small subunit [Selenomonas sp.]MBQ2087166.1 acetolactate synthase small subunit [Selenomonas sp.]MBQ2136950.1 acetolactate synthase small subunit [Selenomonas sp.]